MQRVLVVLLVCMNLGAAVWWAAHREPVPAVLPAFEPGIAPLTLLGESDARPSASADTDDNASPALGADAVCLSLGPLNTPADLRRNMDLLLPKVARIQYREVAATALHGYRVFLPAAGSRAEALATARALAARGVTDYYVVTAGDQQNTVSLGIFRDLDNARHRHDEIAALGYAATIEARTEPQPQWWIDIAAPAGFDWRAVLTDASLQAVSAPCP